MRFRARHDRGRRSTQHDLVRSTGMAAGLAATAVLSYGVGVGLARATQHAEDVEDDEYSPTTHVPLRV